VLDFIEKILATSTRKSGRMIASRPHRNPLAESQNMARKNPPQSLAEVAKPLARKSLKKGWKPLPKVDLPDA